MLLLVEILLTVFAWRKGWKAWALLPLGIGFAVAFILGMGVGAAGGTVDDVLGPSLIIDLLVIVALAVMVAKSPRKATSVHPGSLGSEIKQEHTQ